MRRWVAPAHHTAAGTSGRNGLEINTSKWRSGFRVILRCESSKCKRCRRHRPRNAPHIPGHSSERFHSTCSRFWPRFKVAFP